jgi:ATP-GRASP peptide maturase of grasp-with-spasm system
MILILSTRIGDITTDFVIDWLIFYKQEYFKLTPKSIAFDNEIEIYFPDIHFGNKNKDFIFRDTIVKKIWYRKWNVKVEIDSILSKKNNDKGVKNLLDLLVSETNAISSYLFYRLNNIKWLSQPSDKLKNKLVQQLVAESLGLLTPQTSVLNNQNHIDLAFKEKSTITKLIDCSFSFNKNNSIFQSYTSVVEKLYPQRDIFPSLIQKEIKKQFEIRVFYIEEEIYSAAIFSQQNKQTSTDFRHYDYASPNRIIPYELPDGIRQKITALMKKLNMNTGSIDLIVDTKDDIYFLEVNPFGQFGNISKECNYFLEKLVAENLMKK